MNRWISVKEKLPPHFYEVMVYPLPNRFTVFAHLTKDGWVSAERSIEGAMIEHKTEPTHWKRFLSPEGEDREMHLDQLRSKVQNN